MKNRVIIIIAIVSLILSGSKIAYADNMLSDSKIQSIKDSCKNIEVQIRKIRSKDALKRVKLGGQYENLSNNLMARFNARIALNHMTSINLSSLAVEFNRNLQYFKNNYQNYEREITNLTKISCSKEPNNFYDQLIRVRKAKDEVNFNMDKLLKVAENYKKEVGVFKEGLINEKK